MLLFFISGAWLVPFFVLCTYAYLVHLASPGCVAIHLPTTTANTRVGLSAVRRFNGCFSLEVPLLMVQFFPFSGLKNF